MDVFLKIIPILALLVAITGLIVTITIYFKNKKKKALSYEIEFTIPVIDKVTNDISIYYKDGTEITDKISMVVLKFTNSGNEPINRTDFDKDVFLKFTKSGESSTIYNFNVRKTKPINLDVELFNKNFGETVGFKPLLLNPKEEFYLDILMTDYDKLLVDSRIVGGTVLESKNYQKKFIEIRSFSTAIIASLVALITMLPNTIDSLGGWSAIWTVLKRIFI